MIGEASEFARRLVGWYDAARRDLPWRVPKGEASRHLFPDPYHVLVSELMLQQTQVATVIPYFRRFLERFPTARALADADEQDVLRLWQGLGYYSRARNLQRAAKKVVCDFGGRVPTTVPELLSLPGGGRYTAGAVASLAFGARAPILDGNVARVLCRVDKVTDDPRDRATQDVLWARAEQVLPGARVGDFNSAMMELGATVCIPTSPQCLICPVRDHCEAFAAGVQERIPAPRKAKATPLLERWTFVIRSRVEGAPEPAYLIEQRPAAGRWAGMWQFVTVERPAKPKRPTAAVVRAAAGVDVSPPAPLGEVTHGLTHRRYRFEVFACDADTAPDVSTDGRPRRWATLAGLDAYPLPRPHVLIARRIRGEARMTGEGSSAVSPESGNPLGACGTRAE
jgi:A/G-specific adenine glycosylase